MRTAKILLAVSITVYDTGCADSKKNQNDNARIKVMMPDVSIATEDTMVYWTCGEYNDAYYLLAQSKISEKYGIEFRTQGCLVSDSLIYFLETNKEALFKRLQKKYPALTEESILIEMQDLVTFHKSLENTAFTTTMIERQRRELKPNELLYSTWQADSLSKEEYLLSVYRAERQANKDLLAFIFKINPSTGNVTVKGADGNWSECTK